MPIDSRFSPTRESGRGDYAVSRWYFLNLPPGVTPEHVADPDFWVHMAARLQVNDEIVVVMPDGTFDMELRVIAVDPRKLWAQTRVLRLWQPKVGTKTEDLPMQTVDKDGYSVEWGGAHRWRIIKDGEVVARDLPSKEAAHEALVGIKQAKVAA